MATRTKKLTKKQAEVAIKWFQSMLRIEDWNISIVIVDEPPEDFSQDFPERDVAMGGAGCIVEFKIANIWISPARCVAAKESQLSSLFHELFHVVADDIGVKDDEEPRKQFLWNQLGYAFEQMFLVHEKNNKTN